MPRAKKSFKARRRRNRILKAASGFRGKRSTCFSIANEAVHHAWMHAYAHRKTRKRDFRALWITRINAACRSMDTSYSKFMGALKKNDIDLNRKMLAELAIVDPASFKAIVNTALADA